MCVCFFFFNDTATTEIYTLSLHDRSSDLRGDGRARRFGGLRGDVPDGGPLPAVPAVPARGTRSHGGLHAGGGVADGQDRKSTRLNSSHANISYAVFCLKKKN